MNIGSKHSAETKAKMSKTRMGHPTSQATKDKISKSHIGILQTEESKKKIREKRAIQVITPKMLAALELGRGVNGAHYKDGRMKNPVYVSWLKNQYYRRKKMADGSHTYEEWEILKTQYNWTCPCCGLQEPFSQKCKNLTQDHIIPLSKGGSNNIENIQPLCYDCNCKKHEKIIKYEPWQRSS